jgi:hypothetical protein
VYAHDVEIGDTALKAAQDVVVEVLISKESRHRPTGELRRASKRARIPCAGKWFSI